MFERIIRMFSLVLMHLVALQKISHQHLYVVFIPNCCKHIYFEVCLVRVRECNEVPKIPLDLRTLQSTEQSSISAEL